MPIYEFKCKECGEEISDLIGANDPFPKCKKCGKDSLEKLISKSTGFTIEGYKELNSYTKHQPNRKDRKPKKKVQNND